MKYLIIVIYGSFLEVLGLVNWYLIKFRGIIYFLILKLFSCFRNIYDIIY